MKYILRTENLCKNFKKEEAVKNVSLNIRENSVYGLLGPNGAGKSTILKMVTGMIKETSGNIIFKDSPFKKEDLWEIGALIESPAIYPNLNARENLKVYCLLYGIKEGRIDEVLDLVNLKDTKNKKAKNFSMGMKQRLGIGIALLNNPKLLILDEPTNGLDPLGIEELRDLIKSFPKKGISVILSSHILHEVSLIADDIGIISNGHLGYEGSIDKNIDLEKKFKQVILEAKGC